LSGRLPRRFVSAIALIAIASTVALSGQTVTATASGDLLRVRAPGFGVIRGDTLNRLKNGQTVRFEIELSILAKPGATPALQNRQSFVLSYDLWEERFAVTRAGGTSRSISHLTSPDAESWCLEQLAVPLSDLASFGRGVRFWVRLESRIQDGDGASNPSGDGGYTLRGLIDVLSRRRPAGDVRGVIQGGPFTINAIRN
jgi:hypothetical protein